jgi:N-acetylglucosaminyl-diphospho-decaprenol L-rhamnosyltransferase
MVRLDSIRPALRPPRRRSIEGRTPLGAGSTHILVLNYNGRRLLDEGLPSVVEAARRSTVPCRVTVVDNGSTDGSREALARDWPDVGLVLEPNRGLASFNVVLARMAEPVVLLLNNDVKLDPDAVGPLLRAIDRHPDALFAAPACWTFDGLEYEGMRTRVRSRFGLVQGLCRVPGHESAIDRPDLTASAGPVLAVDRAKFLTLGGYDPIYFPGRIEDLDLGFRGWMAGWRGYYVPESVAYHKGFGSFGPAIGRRGCDRLAARNTLLFAWKNLSGARLLVHLAWLPARVAFALAARRGEFAFAMVGALARLRQVAAARKSQAVGRDGWTARQEAFFERFRF